MSSENAASAPTYGDNGSRRRARSSHSTDSSATGIVSAELVQAAGHHPVSTQACPACSAEGHDADAVCCNYCGERLFPDAPDE